MNQWKSYSTLVFWYELVYSFTLSLLGWSTKVQHWQTKASSLAFPRKGLSQGESASSNPSGLALLNCAVLPCLTLSGEPQPASSPMTDFTPSSQWFGAARWLALRERLRHVSRWHIMTRNRRRFALPQKPHWQHQNSLFIKNRKLPKSTQQQFACYLQGNNISSIQIVNYRTLTPQDFHGNNKRHHFDNSLHEHLLSKSQTPTTAKSGMLGAHETYGFHEPLHRKVQLWKMSVERGGGKRLVPGVRLIMAGYWSGQRAPAMSSRPVGARYVSRSTGLMVFMMARVNRPVGATLSPATRSCSATVRHF